MIHPYARINMYMPKGDDMDNKFLHLADNLDLLKFWYKSEKKAFINLIYIDGPFNSKRNYNILFDSELNEQAFIDTWSSITYLDELRDISLLNNDLYNYLNFLNNTKELSKSYVSYLTNMAIRCWYMREMLKETGSFYYHCDPTMSHYVKQVLDCIFGIDNYRNEIIWSYNTRTMSTKWFAKKHDTIFLYSKSENYKFNCDDVRIPHLPESVVQYYKVDKDGRRYKPQSNGEKTYLNEKGQPCGSVWPIQILGSRDKERLGYPTQKPEKLLERIIKASSDPGDLVADFFMGGGTTIAVAEKLNRNWVGVDINYRALQLTKERLENMGKKIKQDFFIFGIPNSSKDLRKLIDDKTLGIKESTFAFEDVIIRYYLKGVTGNAKQVGDGSIDGRFTFEYNNKKCKGIVQVTIGSNMMRLKSFCSEISKGTGDLGVYITFSDKFGMTKKREIKSYGKIGDVDKIQFLSVEDLIDNQKSFQLPTGVKSSVEDNSFITERAKWIQEEDISIETSPERCFDLLKQRGININLLIGSIDNITKENIKTIEKGIHIWRDPKWIPTKIKQESLQDRDNFISRLQKTLNKSLVK